MIDVWNWFLWCGNEVQVLSQVFLRTSTLYAVTAEVTELNNRKNQKKASSISSQGTGSNTSWKLLVFLIFYAKQERFKRQGKTVEQAVVPGSFKRRYKRSPYDSGVLFYWLSALACIHVNRPVMSWREVVYRLFPQFWRIFPIWNYMWRSIEYNFNWCRHHTLSLKKKYSLSS